ncbi:UNVERIFIED_CONTAM: hypothetical protein NCL1_30001 [Trichonephila clavipes]
MKTWKTDELFTVLIRKLAEWYMAMSEKIYQHNNMEKILMDLFHTQIDSIKYIYDYAFIPYVHNRNYFVIAGTHYNRKAETTSDKYLAETTLTSTKPFTIPVSEMPVPKSSESQSTLQPTCFCAYASFDKYLEAFVGTELLQNGSKVENGNAVKFFCQLFGYLRLQGPAEILCQECHWQTSTFPECAPPKTGETTVLINGDWKLLPEVGTVAIQKGKTVNIQCDVNGVELIPQWIIPEASNINVEIYFIETFPLSPVV